MNVLDVAAVSRGGELVIDAKINARGRELYLQIVNHKDLSDEGWQQASLPVRWGGLGVRSAVMLAPSAYFASAASTATLVLKLLPSCLHHISDRSTPNTLAA